MKFGRVLFLLFPERSFHAFSQSFPGFFASLYADFDHASVFCFLLLLVSVLTYFFDFVTRLNSSARKSFTEVSFCFCIHACCCAFIVRVKLLRNSTVYFIRIVGQGLSLPSTKPSCKAGVDAAAARWLAAVWSINSTRPLPENLSRQTCVTCLSGCDHFVWCVTTSSGFRLAAIDSAAASALFSFSAVSVTLSSLCYQPMN